MASPAALHAVNVAVEQSRTVAAQALFSQRVPGLVSVMPLQVIGVNAQY
jgi:hypothetical protein